jgi:stage IV sporulation protein FB
MLGNAAPTPYDLRFSLFGIPVRVHPFFWLFSALMGWGRGDPKLIVLWVVCVFVSILVHEFGHALAAQSFGWSPHVVLYSFGGYAEYQASWGRTTGRYVAVSFAGPGAGFILYGLVVAARTAVIHFRLVPEDPDQQFYLEVLFSHLEFINLWWGLVNLLPVFPLDGGQISRTLLMHYRRFDGVDISLKLSIAVAAAAAYYLFTHGYRYGGLLFAILGVESYMALQGGVRRW